MRLSIGGKRLLAAVSLMALEVPLATAGDVPPFGPGLGDWRRSTWSSPAG